MDGLENQLQKCALHLVTDARICDARSSGLNRLHVGGRQQAARRANFRDHRHRNLECVSDPLQLFQVLGMPMHPSPACWATRDRIRTARCGRGSRRRRSSKCASWLPVSAAVPLKCEVQAVTLAAAVHASWRRSGALLLVAACGARDKAQAPRWWLGHRPCRAGTGILLTAKTDKRGFWRFCQFPRRPFCGSYRLKALRPAHGCALHA